MLEDNSLALLFNGRFSPFGSILDWCNSQNIPSLIHERGLLLNHISVRFSVKSLDNMMFNSFLPLFQTISSSQGVSYNFLQRLLDFYISGSNPIVKSWKASSSTSNLPISSTSGSKTICLVLSSLDEAYDDLGTPYIECQLNLISTLSSIISNNPDYKLYIKPHPDTISRIDLTVQHSIVSCLLKYSFQPHINVLWPESNISLSDLSAISDLIIVPHSSSVFELSDSSSPIATFIDSPFSSIADFVLTLEQISNTSLLSSVLSYWLTQSRNPSQFNDKLLSLTYNYIF